MAHKPILNPEDWSDEEGTTYLIHFSKDMLADKDPEGAAAGNGAQHYAGWTSEEVPSGDVSEFVLQRFEAHKAGRSGARIIEAALDAGCELNLVRVWPGTTRLFERKLKNHGHHGALCPTCNPVSAMDKYAEAS